jgi:hypothetical protein
MNMDIATMIPTWVDGDLLDLRGHRSAVRGRDPLRHLRSRLPPAHERHGGGVADNRSLPRPLRALGLQLLGPPAEREVAKGARGNS